MKKVLLFGGTFDPIHMGHVQICQQVAKKLSVDKVILIPSAVPPHKIDKKISSFEHRYAMAEIATADFPLFEISDCENKRCGPSYTLATIRYFQSQFGPETQMYWLIGADSLMELNTWYKVSQLVKECKIVTACRPGYECGDLSVLKSKLSDEQISELREQIIETDLFDVSATELRQKLRECVTVQGLIAPRVCEYIQKNHLYR